MTARGLVIGDSHAGMLVDALNGERPGPLSAIELDYFVQPGTGPRDYQIQGTRLIPKDALLIAFLNKIAAPSQPDLADYDFVIIVGCGLSIFPAVQTMGKLTLVGSGKAIWQDLQSHRESDLKPLKHPLVSPDCYQRIVRDKLSACRAISVLGRVSKASDTPIFVVPQPRPRTLLRTLPKRGTSFAAIHKSWDGQMASETFEDAVHSLCQPMANCHVLTQPEETVSEFLFTDEPYCVGALRLSNPGMPQSKRDVLHANSQYGALVLQQICAIQGI